MEEILLELKKKEEMKGTNPNMMKYNSVDEMGARSHKKDQDEEELRLRMFSLDMVGGKSSASLKPMAGMKNTRNY